MGFFERLKNSWNIFKFSFGLIKKDKSLIAIPILMLASTIILGILFSTTFFSGVGSENEIKNLATIFWMLMFLFLIYFITIFYASAQSWMVHEVVQGKNTTLGSGFKRAFRNFFDIFLFTIVFIFIMMLASILRKKGIVGKIAGGFIQIFSKILGKLVIPAMIVSERNFGQAVGQLKESYKAIPEIATYEIGIRPLKTIATFAGLFLAFMFAISLSIYVGIMFFAIWIILLILIGTYVNITYYTLVYLTLIEKKKIKGLKIF